MQKNLDENSYDKRIEKVMVPFGDGMTVCRKI